MTLKLLPMPTIPTVRDLRVVSRPRCGAFAYNNLTSTGLHTDSIKDETLLRSLGIGHA